MTDKVPDYLINHPRMGEGIAHFIGHPNVWDFFPHEGHPVPLRATLEEVQGWEMPKKELFTRMEHVSLTTRQREIAQMALGLLDLDRDVDVTADEIQATLNAITPPEEPEPRVEHIPVLWSMGDMDPIGFGHIAGNTLFIQVKTETLVDAVAQLAKIGHIRELYLGLGFPAYKGVSISMDRSTVPVEQTRAERDAQIKTAKSLAADDCDITTIAQQLDLPVDTVRLLLEAD